MVGWVGTSFRSISVLTLAASSLIATSLIAAPGARPAGATPPGPSIASSAAQAFVPITPYRLLDTRSSAPITSSQDRSLPVRGTEAVPIAAVAVALNVTITQPTSTGWLAVWPGGGTRPPTSNLNFLSGETVANLVTIGIGPDGSISLGGEISPVVQKRSSLPGTTHVLVDVVGWYMAGFNPITPYRVLDTRSEHLRLGPGEQRDIVVAGLGGLPDGAGAVGLNVTAAGPSAAGYLTVWPNGTDQPPTSNLNFAAGETAANAVIVGVGSYGKISIFNESGTTDVIVDVAGWFSAGFDALTPFRVLDTRQDGQFALAPGETRVVRVTGRDGVPSDAGGVSMNVTVADPSEAGYLTVYPAGRTQPDSSSLNFSAHQTIPSAVVSGVNTAGEIAVHNPFGTTDLLIDVTGWYARSDIDPPEILSLELDRTSVDSSAAEQVLTATVHLRDDLAGLPVTGGQLNRFGLGFQRSAQGPIMFSGIWTLVSGTPLDGVFRTEIRVPRWSPTGSYQLYYVTMADAAGNEVSLDLRNRSDLSVIGFQQTGPGDEAGAQIRSVTVLTPSTDSSNGPATVTVRAWVTDASPGAGTGFAEATFCGSGDVYGMAGRSASFGDSNRLSGDAFDGIYEATVTLPRYSAAGTWRMCRGNTFDLAGNHVAYDAQQSASFGASFEQTGAGDTSPPVVRSVTVTPSTISTNNGPATVSVTVRVTDDLAGLAPGRPFVSFQSLSGQSQYSGLPVLESGNGTDGVWRLDVVIPQYAESGVWSLSQLIVADEAGNWLTYWPWNLQQIGLGGSFINN